jgi:hypothetical protein
VVFHEIESDASVYTAPEWSSLMRMAERWFPEIGYIGEQIAPLEGGGEP